MDLFLSYNNWHFRHFATQQKMQKMATRQANVFTKQTSWI
jgi:hypothetical protein